MNNVENRVVEMKFDNAQFEQAVAQTMSTLDKFKEKLNFDNAGKGIEKVGSLADNFSGILGGLGTAVDRVAEHFQNLSGVGERVFSVLTSSVTGFITSGLSKLSSDIVQGGQSRAMNLEQAKFQLQGILGDAEEVNRVIYDDILPELQGTPFSLDQAAVVMGQLAASGKKSSEEVQQGTRAIAGAAAMTNSSFADMGRIFTKVAGNGRVMGDTLQEMSSRGLNAAADIGKVFDMTEAEVREAVTAGEISYEMFAQAMDELYGEQATKSTTMYTGALEDLRAALARIGAEPQAVKLEFLRDAFNALVPAVDAVNAVLKPWINSAHATEEYLDENGEKATRYAKAFQGPLAQSIQQTGWEFQKLFVKLDDNNDILRYSKKNWKELGLTMEEDEDGVKHYYQTLKKANGEELKVERDFGEAVMNPNMYRIMTAAAQSFVNVVAALGKLLGAVGKGIVAAFPKLTLKSIAAFVEGIQDFTKALVLSDTTLKNIKYIVQAVFTPLGILVRIFITAAKVLVEFGKIVYHALAPTFKVITSMVGVAAAVFSGLGKAVDNAAADITGMAQKLYGAAKSFAKFLGLDKLANKLRNGLEKLSQIFGKVSHHSYEFLANLSENAKKAGAAIYKKLRLDEFGKKLVAIKDKLKAAFMATGYAGFEKIVEIFNKLKESIKKLFSSTLSLDKVGASIKDLGLKILDMIPTDKILAALDKFAVYLTRVVYAIAGFVGPKVEAAIDFFKRIAKHISLLFKAFKGFVSVFGIIDTLKMALFAFSKIIPRLFGFKSFGDILDTVKSKIAGFIQVFKEFIESILGGAKGGLKNFGDNMTKGLKGFINDDTTGKIQTFGKIIKQFYSTLKVGVSFIVEKLKEFYAALDSGDKKRILAGLSAIVMMFSYLRTINKIGKSVKGVGLVFKSIAGIGNAISGFGGALTNFSVSISALNKARKRMLYLIGIASSLLIFAATLAILGRMDMDTLIQGGIAAIGSLIALSVALAILDKVAGKTPEGAANILKLAGSMAAVGAAIYLISKSMANMAVIYKTLGGTGYAVIVATLVGMLVAFGVLAKTFSKMDKMEVSLKSAGIAMLAIAAAIKLMVGSMVAIGSMDTGSLIKGGGVIVVLLGLMTALSYFAGRNDNVAKAATALATLTASLLLLSLALRIYALFDPDTFIHGLVFMAVTMAALLGVMTLFKTVSGPKEAGGIIAIAVAVGILAGALLILSAVPIMGLGKALLFLVLGFAAIAAIMAVFSSLSVGMLAVAGAFALLGVAMLFVGAGALGLAVALSMLVPIMMALSAAPKEMIQGGLETLAIIANGLKSIFLDLSVGLLAFGAALLVAAVAAVVLGAGILLIGAGLLVASIGLVAFSYSLAITALTIQALFGGDFLAGIGQGLKNFGEIAKGGLSRIVEGVKGIFSKDKGKETTQDYVDGGKEALDESSPDLQSSWDNTLNKMSDSTANKKGEFKDSMADLMSSNTEGVEAGLPELEDAFGGGLDNLTDIADVKSGDISDTLGKIPGDAGSAIKDNKGKYSSALSSMFSDGNKEVKKSSKENKKVAKDNAKVYTEELNSNESKKSAAKATKELNDSAKKSFSNVSSEYKTFGKNAGDGFKSGISSKVDEVARESARMVREAMNAAKREQNSHSPSKEFAKFGRWADEGYILGLKSLSGQVSKAAADMVGGGIDAVTDAMSYIANISDMSFDFDPTITPVVDLTNIDQSVSEIGAMFGSSFGVNTAFGASSAAIAARAFTDIQNQSDRLDAINKLANRIDSMTESMNSRSLNVYNTIDGTADPEAFADGLVRSFRLNARTV